MNKWLIFILLILSTSFWGGNFNAGKLAVEHMEPFSIAAWRFGIAAICMLILLGIRERFDGSMFKRNFWAYVLLGVVGVFGFNVLFFVGLKHTSAMNGSLIMAANPLVTVLLSALILREKITKRQAIGIAISLVGVVSVITKGSLDVLLSMDFSKGDLIINAGSICWALYAVLGKKYLKQSTALATTAYSMAVGALLMLPFTALEAGSGAFFDQAISVQGAILFMALLGSVLAYLWWNQGIAKIGASKTSIFFNLVPIWTMVISLATGGTILTVQVVGGILVISGVLFSSGFSFGAKKAAPEIDDQVALQKTQG
ncbi:MAG TPA: DMT family transporter [Bacilli bacterium]|nr:DMT family transporter [Bacilli bacterium]